MSVAPSSSRRLRLGDFDIDLRAGELRKRGHRIRLQEKPFQLLAALLERPGELVTRDELRRRLWPADTFVDFDGSLNAAVNRLRDALGDSAGSPRFIETLPRRGYRLIVPVETAEDPTRAENPAPPAEMAPRRGRTLAAAALVVLTAGAAIYGLFGGVSHRAAAPERILLGVLPLEDFADDSEGGILAQALTDELTTELGRQAPGRLGVIAGTSMRAYGRQGRTIAEIGSEFGLDYVVEGGVKRSSGGVRITIRLVDVSSQAPVWVDDFDEELRGFADVESKAARMISHALALELLQEPEPAGASASAADPAAYESYLKGRYFRERMTADGFRKGLEHFGEAIAKDPSFARAYAGLAGCYCLLGGHGMELEPPHEVLPKAEQAARRALALNASLPEAHAALGMIALKYHWDLPKAKRRFERALELNPSYAQAYLWFSLHYEVTGDADRAIELADQARSLDPLSIPALVNLAQQYGRAGRYEDAAAALDEVLELDPGRLGSAMGAGRWL